MSERLRRSLPSTDGLKIVPTLPAGGEEEVQQLADLHQQVYDVWYDIAHQRWLICDRTFEPDVCQYHAATVLPRKVPVPPVAA